MFSHNFIPHKAFETVAPMNEELKRMEFDRAFCEKFKFLVDRFSSFFGLRQVEKMIHQKKNWGHCTSKNVKSTKS